MLIVENVKEIFGRQWSRKTCYVMKLKQQTNLTYLRHRVSTGEKSESAVTARAKCQWVMLRVCAKLLYRKAFVQKLKRAVYKSYVRLAIWHGSKTWCMKKT